MKRYLPYPIWLISQVLLIILIWGCAAAPPKPPAPPEPAAPPASTVPAPPTVERDPFSVFPELYRQKAAEYEKKGELSRALQSWQIVNNFIPADAEAAQKIGDLKTQMQTLADQHFKKGVSAYQNNSLPAARKEFLLALSCNPDHMDALNYLKNKLTGEDYRLYEVQKGDTLKEVARKTYNDPQKDFLIAYFNDLGKNVSLTPKTALKIPILESTPPPPPERSADVQEITLETKEMLSKATGSFRAKEYRETVSLAEKVLQVDPLNREAGDLINASYYQMGTMLSQQEKYQEALAMFNRVDTGYKDVKNNIAVVKKKLAETHYIKGVKYFVDEKLDNAIKEWETTLTLDPNHPKAKTDMENARSLLQKLKAVQ